MSIKEHVIYLRTITNRKEIPVVVNVRFRELGVLAASGDGGSVLVAGEKKAE